MEYLSQGVSTLVDTQRSEERRVVHSRKGIIPSCYAQAQSLVVPNVSQQMYQSLKVYFTRIS